MEQSKRAYWHSVFCGTTNQQVHKQYPPKMYARKIYKLGNKSSTWTYTSSLHSNTILSCSQGLCHIYYNWWQPTSYPPDSHISLGYKIDIYFNGISRKTVVLSCQRRLGYYTYSLFTLQKPCSQLKINWDRGFLREQTIEKHHPKNQLRPRFS